MTFIDEATEITIEERTMTEPNTDDTSTKTIADGGTEEIRNGEEVSPSLKVCECTLRSLCELSQAT